MLGGKWHLHPDVALRWNKMGDPTGQDNTCATSRVENDESNDLESRYQSIRVISDALPISLARVFGVLATLAVMPNATCSALSGEGTIEIQIDLKGTSKYRADLLYRKLLQLTDTITIDKVASS